MSAVRGVSVRKNVMVSHPSHPSRYFFVCVAAMSNCEREGREQILSGGNAINNCLLNKFCFSTCTDSSKSSYDQTC